MREQRIVVRTSVKAGGQNLKHTGKRLVVASGLRAGGTNLNHAGKRLRLVAA